MDFQGEYTGTAWITCMGETGPIPDVRGQWEAVRDRDKANGLEWLPPAGWDNTYAFTVTEENARRLGVETLVDVKDIPASEQTFCVDAEFAALTERLDNDAMSRLNQRVDVDGAEPALVAWEWLVEEGLVSAD